MANHKNTVLYTGVTNNLVRRVLEHKNKINPECFTSKYNCDKLVYFECGESILGALDTEKQIKAGSRAKKIKLIEENNPEWKDLFNDLVD